MNNKYVCYFFFHALTYLHLFHWVFHNTHINPTDLWFNLPGVSGKESEEALRSGVDDVDLVEGDRVDHLLPLLQLALGALHEPRTRTWEYKEETNELSCQQLEVTELPIMFKCDNKKLHF